MGAAPESDYTPDGLPTATGIESFDAMSALRRETEAQDWADRLCLGIWGTAVLCSASDRGFALRPLTG